MEISLVVTVDEEEASRSKGRGLPLLFALFLRDGNDVDDLPEEDWPLLLSTLTLRWPSGALLRATRFMIDGVCT